MHPTHPTTTEHPGAPPFTIVRAYGPLRRAAERYLEAHHDMRSSGRSGAMFAVIRDDASVAGACQPEERSVNEEVRNCTPHFNGCRDLHPICGMLHASLAILYSYDRFQPALWRGAELTRTAAPVWVPLRWERRLLDEPDVAHETVAGRRYAPFDSAAPGVGGAGS